jgi:ABC-2 type transport system permease protein
VYLISGFRWSFFGQSDVGVGWSLLATSASSACAWRWWRGSSRRAGG